MMRMVQRFQQRYIYCVHLCQLRTGIMLHIHSYLYIQNFSSTCSVQLDISQVSAVNISHGLAQRMSEISS